MKGHILVVDDEAHVTRLMRLRLEAEGWSVTTALNGQEALGACEATRFDVVVTDFAMPGMNGRELCEAILGRADGTPPLLLLATSRADDELERWAVSLGSVRFVAKPVSVASLLVMIDEALKPEETGG